MRRYEYKVVPAPRRGEKAKGVKSTEERFALAISNLMNRLGAEGWEYLRSDTLQAVEKAGWFSRPTVTEQAMLVFRRDVAAEPAFVPAPTYAAPAAYVTAPAPVAPASAEPLVAPVLGRETPAERQQREARERFADPAPQPERFEPRFAARREDPVETRAPRLGPARGE